MSEDIYNIEIEQVFEDWDAGELEIDDAHDVLIRLGHDPEEANDMLRAHDRDKFEEQERNYDGALAGVI
jgi:hypothetical protein